MSKPRTRKPKEPTPLIKDLSDKALIEHFEGLRALAYNAARIKSPRLGSLLRQQDICVAVARKRGLQLPAGGGWT